MSYEENLRTISIEAGSDLSAGQYLFVDIAADKQIDIVGTIGLKAVGVLQDKPAAIGRPGSVGISGVTKVVAGQALDPGDQVVSSAAGKAVDSTAVDQIYQGIILEPATADGDIVAMLIQPMRRHA